MIIEKASEANFLITFNPSQAGVFWNPIGRGAHCAPLCFSFICGPITTKLGMMVL